MCANHSRPSGSFAPLPQTARMIERKNPMTVETDMRAGRLRQWSERMAKRTVMRSWVPFCAVGIAFMSSME